MRSSTKTYLLLIVIAAFAMTPAFGLPPEATDRPSMVKNIPSTWRVLSWAPPDKDGGPAEFRPANQMGEQWTQSIKIRNFSNGPFHLDEFTRGLTRFNHVEQCDYHTQSTPEAHSKNGFDSVSVVDLCGTRKGSGRGEITIYKAIAYPGWIAVGERTIKLPAFDGSKVPMSDYNIEMLRQWADGFYLCSPGMCPAIR